jgi:hypothetical protein
MLTRIETSGNGKKGVSTPELKEQLDQKKAHPISRMGFQVLVRDCGLRT